jgi:uncharacterized protein (DUF2336 family)
MQKLSNDDVVRLLNEPSTRARVTAAGKVASIYSRELMPNERAVAEEIFRLLLRDIDSQVRQALSMSLRDNPAIPHDIALTLARDVESVAVPMLHMSMVLTDDDLIEIVRSRPVACQVAIAQRPTVSQAVSGALIETENAEVVATLLHNPGSEIAEPELGEVIDLFSGQRVIMDAMAERHVLPPRIAERLVALISENLRLNLALGQHLSPDVADALILHSRERVAMGLWPQEMDAQEVADLIDQLHSRSRLTPSIILRALCEGDFVFVTAALARRADIGIENAWSLVHDQNELGLTPLFKRAGLGEELLDLAYLSVRIARNIEAANELEARFLFRKKLVSQFSAHWPDLKGGSDMETLIARLLNAGIAGPVHGEAA